MASIINLLFPLALLTVAFAAEKPAAKGESNYTVTSKVYFDIEIRDPSGFDEEKSGRIVIGLFGEVCPMTVLNFEALSRGYKRGGEKLQYRGNRVHRIVRDFVIQLGDVTVGDGSGGRSIYGDKFVDENFILSHRATGFVSMANHGKDTNGSQFFILLNRARWLDGKHVVFGKVLKGMKFLREIGEVEANPDNAVPKKTVKVSDCGVLEMKGKRVLTTAEIDAEDDIPDA